MAHSVVTPEQDVMIELASMFDAISNFDISHIQDPMIRLMYEEGDLTEEDVIEYLSQVKHDEYFSHELWNPRIAAECHHPNTHVYGED